MSDPVTNAEVEDVLSSIRRLVSEDKRPVQVPKAETRNDRLVLTPSLRVTDDVTNHAEPDSQGGPVTSSQATADAIDDTGAEEAIDLTIGSLVTDDLAIDVYDDEHAQGHSAEVSDLAQHDEDGIPDEPDRIDPAHDYSDDHYRFDDDDNTDGEDLDDVILTGSTSETYNVVAGHSDADEPETDWTMETADVSENQKTGATQTNTTVDSAEQESPSEGEEKSASLTAKITALETAIGKIADTWEPDDAGDGDYAGSEPQAMAWEDDQPENVIEVSRSVEEIISHQDDREEMHNADVNDAAEVDGAASETEPFVAAATSGPSADHLDIDGDAQLIDEDALRDLVSDIVRAELQGALGERITRNVRKLVRREIHRALTAQDLE